MASKPRSKMAQADRAKQFMPFAALTGLDAALEAKEKIVVPAKELSEEMLSELNEAMHQIQKGDIVTVVYYYKDEYLQMTGIVARLDENARLLQLVNTKIGFDQIYSIEKV